MTIPRILSVDDCIDTHELLKEALEGEFEVYGMETAERFDEAVEVVDPDLIFLDLLMPHIGGLKLLEKIQKEGGPAKTIPVIILTAKKDSENQKKAYDLGASLYLTKPFEPDRLLRNLKIFMEGNRLEVKEKMFKLAELDRKIKMRSSFHTSQIVSEEELRGGIPTKSPSDTISLGGTLDAKNKDEEAKKKRGPSWLN